MEINGKKVLTLPQQVLQNQKDIAELKEEMDDIKKKYQHRIILKAGSYKGFAIFDIVNETSTAYTTLDQVIEQMGTKTYPAVTGIVDDTNGVNHIYEIGYDPANEVFDLEGVVLNEDEPLNSISMTFYKDYVTKL